MVRIASIASAAFVITAAGGLTGCLNAVDTAGPQIVQPPTWNEFLSQTYREPSTGTFIVDGDVPMADEKHLHEFYDHLMGEVQAEQDGSDSGQKEQGLILGTSNGSDVVWTATQAMNLTWCVSSAFGAAKEQQVIDAMTGATAAWEAATQVHWTHVTAQDGAGCTVSNNNVLFDINPVNAGGSYIARSFFPNDPRSNREVLIDPSGFTVTAPLTLTGVLRHELGHTIGFRHEHTRPEAGTCFEDNNWRVLTPYDSASVMHYPQCNGTGDWSLTLTDLDKQGAALVYGNPGGAPPPPPPSGDNQTTTSTGSVAKNAQTALGTFPVLAGTTFTATMTGTGDPDLYVQFGAAPTTTSYACRPYVNGPNETCTLTVPAGATQAFVAVRGYTASTYNVVITYTAPDGAGNPPPPPPPPSGGTATTSTLSGSVAKSQNSAAAPFAVVAGTSFTATMTGTGDPDLYVRFGAAPTTTTYACRPYVNGPNESCALTVPAGTTQAFVMVRGFTAATYNVNVAYTTP